MVTPFRLSGLSGVLLLALGLMLPDELRASTTTTHASSVSRTACAGSVVAKLGIAPSGLKSAGTVVDGKDDRMSAFSAADSLATATAFVDPPSLKLVAVEPLKLEPGEKRKVTVSVVRTNCPGKIELTLAKPSPGVKMEPGLIAETMLTTDIELQVAEDAKAGERTVLLRADALKANAEMEVKLTVLPSGATIDAAVRRGLLWLALHQAPQGYWALDAYHTHERAGLNATMYTTNANLIGKGQRNDMAGCAFGLLPFLAVGITHKPSGRAEDDQYVNTVKRALEWLSNNQDKTGRFGGSSMYEHGLATIAVCRAYALTADPALKVPAQKAINFIVQAQHEAGGWRYQPKQAGDTSVTGWQITALKAGEEAGLKVPANTLQLATKYLDSCESTDGGGYGYTGPGDAPTMSAAGLYCRLQLGTPRRNINLRNGVTKLLQFHPPQGTNAYYEHYATAFLKQLGGESWDRWRNGAGDKKGIQVLVLEKQDKDGSWDSRGDGHCAPGGRIMKTSLSLVILQMCKKHPPGQK